MNHHSKNYSFIVIGGGMSGLIAAIAAARGGVQTALVHNRPVLGGNASSEIRMHVCGAGTHGPKDNARETGILEEIMLENKYRNPDYNYPIWDTILWEKVKFQDNLDLYLNTHVNEVKVVDGKITSLEALQLTTEKTYTFIADTYADCTGDGTIASLAGASFMSGREAKETFDESYAPEVADHICMGNTLLFQSSDAGKPMPFIKPFWANTYTEEDLSGRRHGSHGDNYWWVELGGMEEDTISDGEIIRDELLKAVYGVWDHIKNSGEHDADNYQLDWVGMLPGKRESRRIMGDYVLNQKDLLASKVFEDAVAYGGWPMDMHVPGGLRTRQAPTEFIQVPDLYTIPYRSLYSKDMNNLFIGGRCVSASHMAFGSLRVMGTTAVIGQAIGTAARFITPDCPRPKDLLSHIQDLQQTLIREDAHIPGYANTDAKDLAKSMTVTASSSTEGTRPEAVINGITRNTVDKLHYWAGKKEDNPTLRLSSNTPITLNAVELKFDSNLSGEIAMTMFNNGYFRQQFNLPDELVKDYTITFLNKNKEVHKLQIKDNHQRLCLHHLESPITCTDILINCHATYGCDEVRIFEVRVYC